MSGNRRRHSSPQPPGRTLAGRNTVVGVAFAAAGVAVLAVTTLTGGLRPAVGAADPVGEAPATVAAEGLMVTLAGPGYCPLAATEVAGSRAPRAVAVGGDGQVYFETGPPADPVITTVTSEGAVRLRQAGVPQPAEIANAPDAVADSPAVAGRLAVEDDGAVLIAAGTRIERVDAVDEGSGAGQGVTAPGVRITVAGDQTGELGGVGPSQVDGPTGEARFRHAASLARDADGLVYIADQGGAALARPVVRVLNQTGEPTTFYAGTADELTVEPGQVVTLTATPTTAEDTDRDTGTGEGDGETRRARQAGFHGNATLAVDGDALYVVSAKASLDAKAIVELINLGSKPLSRHGQTVEPGGIATVAGDGETTIGGAGGVAAADGQVVIADPVRHRVHRLDPEGFLGTVAGAEGVGETVGGFNGNRQAATDARLNQPVDVALGDDGEIYVADRENAQLRVVDPAGTIRATAGNHAGLAWQCESDDAVAGRMRLRRPGGPASLATDPDGAVYIALADVHQIIRRAPSGEITTVVGTGEAGFSGDGGSAANAQLDTPTAIALDEDRLYIYDGGNARLRLANLTDTEVTAHGVAVPAGGITTIAGAPDGDAEGDAGGRGGSAVGEPIGEVATPPLVELGGEAAAGFSRRIPHTNLGDLAIDDDGALVLAEPPQHPDGGAYRPDEHDETTPVAGRVRRLSPDGKLTTLLGDDRECCASPTAIAVDGGRLYVADAATHQVWLHNRGDERIQAHGQTIAPDKASGVAGSGERGFTAQADDATTASLLSPSGLATGDKGGLYLAHLGIADDGPPGHYLHHLTAEGALAVVAGTGQAGFNGDTRPPRVTAVNLSTDLTRDPCDNLLIADTGNDRLRRLTLTGPCPAAAEPAAPTETAGGSGLPVAALAAAGGGAVALAAAGWRWQRHRRRHP